MEPKSDPCPPLYFYRTDDLNGFLSNFYPCSFREVEYNCSEQYFMKKKQELFEPDNFSLSEQIVRTHSAGRIKSLGRMVKNYDAKLWSKQSSV